MTKWFPGAAVVISLCAVPALAQPAFFLGLGDLAGGNFNSGALGVSADGSVAVGWSNSFDGGFGGEPQAFRWTSELGMVGLGDLPGGAELSSAWDVSPDGGFVVGESSSHQGTEGFLWSAGTGMIGLGDLPGGSTYSYAADVSRGGRVVVGYSSSEASSSRSEAYRWTLTDGMVGLGSLPGGSFSSTARGVSADGSVIVGTSNSAGARRPTGGPRVRAWSGWAILRAADSGVLPARSHPTASTSPGTGRSTAGSRRSSGASATG